MLWLTCRSLVSVIVVNFHSSDLSTFLSWKEVCMCRVHLLRGSVTVAMISNAVMYVCVYKMNSTKYRETSLLVLMIVHKILHWGMLLHVLWYKVFQFFDLLILKVYFDITNSVVTNVHGSCFSACRKECAWSRLSLITLWTFYWTRTKNNDCVCGQLHSSCEA